VVRPLNWFARGLAGGAWLPADEAAPRVFVFDVARQQWSMCWQFPDAVSDFAHPRRAGLLPDGLIGWRGTVQATSCGWPVGALECRWRFAIAGTQHGEIGD
jgi:hypothetical protein